MKYDPDNAQIYKQNAERYKAKIRQMADPLRAELEKFPPISAGWSPVKARSLTARDNDMKSFISGQLTPINRGRQNRCVK